MEIRVADASAIAAVLFAEPDAEAVAERFASATLVAPTLLPLEVANVCWIKIRKHPSQRSDLLDAFAAFDRLRVELVEVDPRASLNMAVAAGLTVYDACYLWLARQLDAEIVTLDQALARAAASP